MSIIEIIHYDGLSDIINPTQIVGVTERKKDDGHSFVVYSHNTKWVIYDNDKIILSELNMNLAQVDSEISFEDFKSKIKGIILDSQITRL